MEKESKHPLAGIPWQRVFSDLIQSLAQIGRVWSCKIACMAVGGMVVEKPASIGANDELGNEFV